MGSPEREDALDAAGAFLQLQPDHRGPASLLQGMRDTGAGGAAEPEQDGGSATELEKVAAGDATLEKSVPERLTGDQGRVPGVIHAGLRDEGTPCS